MPSKRHPITRLASSGPVIEMLSGRPLGYSMGDLNSGTVEGFMYEKCSSIISINSSGLKSPTIIIAMLLGT